MVRLFCVIAAGLPALCFAQSSALSNAAKLREIAVVTDPGYAGGAKCDGATDDTKAMQAALNSGANTVLLPSGTCLTSALTMPSNIELVGHGPNSSILKAKNSTNTDLISVSSKSFVAFKNFRIEGNSVSQTQAA